MKANTGIKKQNIKANNRFAILDIVKKRGAMSRKEIAKEINLTPAAVTILTGELIHEGIIKEVAEVNENRAGRRSILIDIDNKNHLIICIYLDITGMEIAATYFDGKLIAARKKGLAELNYHVEVMDSIADECESFIADHDLLRKNRNKIIYIGFSIVGIVDEESGISKKSFGVLPPGVQIQKNLQKRLGIPVVVENNVRALAMAEIDYHSDRNMENAMFIKLGPGVGSALIINRDIYKGSNNVAGEMGHVFCKENDKQCVCGKKGCLETVIGEGYILEECKQIFSQDQTAYLYHLCEGRKELVTFGSLVLAAQNGDYLIQQTFDNAAKCLAIAMDNAMHIVDVKNVILFGTIAKNNIFYSMLMKHLDILNENRNYILEHSRLDCDEQYKGCSAIASRKFIQMISETV